MIKVAIVIVCMNNLKNLTPCLDSIIRYTKTPYEIWVNAYMFTRKNLDNVRKRYPDVNWVVNNEITGFSENNNIILKQINAKYALILNDDTELFEPMIDSLVTDLEKNSYIDFLSPVLYTSNREKVQFCGRNPISAMDFILMDMSIVDRTNKPSKYINQKGLFKTYNLSGACFLARTKTFKTLGWFDEYYFFCPEDIAIGTLANKKGYQVWVDANVGVIHYGGQTRKSKVKMATLPALKVGCLRFWGEGNPIRTLILAVLMLLASTLKCLLYLIKKDEIEYKAQFNSIKAIICGLTPNAAFRKYYRKIK